MNSLSTRRRLLVAESELQRVTMSDDWRSLAGHAATFCGRAKAGGRRTAGWAAAGFAAWVGLRLLVARGRPAGVRPPPGLVSRLFGLAQAGVSLWTALRPLWSGRPTRRPRK